MLNTNVAKIGDKEWIYKVLTPVVFLVTYTNKKNTCKFSYALWSQLN